MNEQLIKQIEQQLALAKTAASSAAFEKHMYAIQTLASLGAQALPYEQHMPSAGTTEISAAELKMMGGTVTGKTAETDDGYGNGESLFDF